MSVGHHDVLFLDEFTVYRRRAFDALHARWRTGSRAEASSRTMWILARRRDEPCRCSDLDVARPPCRCAEHQLETYRARLSGPLLDRFDVHASVARLERSELLSCDRGESSDAR